MSDLVQLTVSGIATGAIYALAALGFTLLWQAAGVISDDEHRRAAAPLWRDGPGCGRDAACRW